MPVFFVGMLFCCGGVVLAGSIAEASDRRARESDFYIEEASGIEEARLEVVMEAGEIRMSALNDSANLFEADLTWIGDLEYSRIDDTEHIYRIAHSNRHQNPLEQFFSFMDVAGNWESEPVIWDIELNDSRSLDLDVRNSAGVIDLDLRTINLSNLFVRGSAGEVTLSLPEPAQSYTVEVVNNVGATQITLPPNANVEIIAGIDAGTIAVSPALVRVEYDENNEVGESGIWRSAGFDAESPTITINYTGGIGELSIE